MDRPFPTWVLWLIAAAVATAIALLVGIRLLGRRRRAMPKDLERVSATAGRSSKPAAFMPPPTTMAGSEVFHLGLTRAQEKDLVQYLLSI